ncbi:hypothetical protein EAO69_42375 [Streptomyces sp. me109]|nr:hypothetical protein EAO69_42375 [Streptomyces sp. me109]
MITLNVYFDVAQEHEAGFLKLLHHMVVESKREYDEYHYEEIPRRAECPHSLRRRRLRWGPDLPGRPARNRGPVRTADLLHRASGRCSFHDH